MSRLSKIEIKWEAADHGYWYASKIQNTGAWVDGQKMLLCRHHEGYAKAQQVWDEVNNRMLAAASKV